MCLLLEDNRKPSVLTVNMKVAIVSLAKLALTV